MKHKGFTLIELMIVVAIIAIIAAIAIPSLLRSRMAANSTAAAAACKAFAEAEEIFHRTDYDADGVLEYSTALSGNNSLLEKTAGAGDLVIIDKSFAGAEGEPGVATPKAGYCFKVLSEQGPAAPPGAKSYMTGTNMTLGYGLCATPASYDTTGRDTFIINNTGTIYQSDRGAAATSQMTWFNPAAPFTPTE